MPDSYRPKVGFMIIGAQKCGTTALGHFLSQHPEIGMPSHREVHLFDAPEYSTSWTSRQIDERYGPHFTHCPSAVICGEATPIYIFFPEIARELKRYNPRLKLIVLLRDPIERAISHYHMERDRGNEHLPLWKALLSERARLHRCKDVRAVNSAMRVYSYRRRGLYSLQILNVHQYFQRENILIVRTRDLQNHHDASLKRIFVFLGVSEHVRITPETIYPNTPRTSNHKDRTHGAVAWLLRLSYLAEFLRLRFLSIRL